MMEYVQYNRTGSGLWDLPRPRVELYPWHATGNMKQKHQRLRTFNSSRNSPHFQRIPIPTDPPRTGRLAEDQAQLENIIMTLFEKTVTDWITYQLGWEWEQGHRRGHR